MGRSPQPFYDPLEFAVKEAHKRGLELHAWFNPYRAHHPETISPISENHLSKTKPELVKKYGKYMWLDPGEKQVQDYSLKVILDVVNRYDIDGVHIDDNLIPIPNVTKQTTKILPGNKNSYFVNDIDIENIAVSGFSRYGSE